MIYKTAIVTGASRGLGREIAKAFASEGLNVMLAARHEPDLRAVTESLIAEHGNRIAYTVVDLRSPESISLLFAATRQRFGMADVLVNNAGIGRYKPFTEWTETEIVDTAAVNLTALMLCTKAVLPEMMAIRRGFIINIASDLARKFLPNMSPYVATKFGALGFSGSLLREVKSHGIKVCTVMPGIIDTNFNDSQEGSREETWALRPEVLAKQIAGLLSLPPHVVQDEMVIHPMQQEF
ncbi:MAG: SDR family NAD(P)-dependent oxidoreductase [Rhizobacter sp.]|nr:SDR family NAD(P)-dependent oxidoreductase [Chlorobiales bacterium]